MPDIENLIQAALALPRDAVCFNLSKALAEATPDHYLLETDDQLFDLDAFALEGQCCLSPRDDVYSQFSVTYDQEHRTAWSEPYNSWRQAEWKGHRIDVVTIGLQGTPCRELRHFILAPSEEIGYAFFEAVCEWNREVRGEVLVFNGYWYKSAALYQAISQTTLDSLVLEDGLREELIEDFTSFFEKKELYARYRIPWKRGVLLLGPPGNGKTHAIKGLIHLLQKPCLYVRSFKAEYQTDHSLIHQVFAKARSSAPCILVLEDLDSLLDDQNRSYFLNEMDGFAANEGVLTLATTNHPERLDPAILERPSRFDRKYVFSIPGATGRQEFLSLFNAQLQEELRLNDGEVCALAEETQGFSYAYLKELFLSSMMEWIRAPGAHRLVETMRGQIGALLSQMHAPIEEPPEEEAQPHAAAAYMRRWRRPRR